MEGAGEVIAVGPGVTDLKVGDRVVYAGAAGSYATERVIPAEKVVKIPDGIDYKTAAGMMLQGMTVRYLLRKTYKVGPGTTLLMHAAAGGIGLIACQWAKHLGATLIGTAGTDEKCKLALAHGATHCINYSKEKFVDRVKEITGGKGCDVVYDSIGKDTFPASLDCLKPLGLFVTFGNASGPIDAFNAGVLAAKGSLYMTRPTLNTYTAARADLVETANDLFDVVKKGAVKIAVNHTYPLKDAGQAHRDLEGRKTTGSIVLLP
jgi:NADPH2:quinone reductase